ncbi:MAG: DUF4307 domain-containing protein [Frankiaceae bacterium]
MAHEGPAAVRPDRYGTPRRSMRPAVRRWLAVAGVALAVVVAGLAWAASRPGAEATVTAIRFGAEHHVDVTFEVRKPAGATAVCVVRARDASGAQTGYEQVRVGPAHRSVVTVTHRLATKDRAVTGEVAGCSLSGRG